MSLLGAGAIFQNAWANVDLAAHRHETVPFSFAFLLKPRCEVREGLPRCWEPLPIWLLSTTRARAGGPYLKDVPAQD